MQLINKKKKFFFHFFFFFIIIIIEIAYCIQNENNILNMIFIYYNIKIKRILSIILLRIIIIMILFMYELYICVFNKSPYVLSFFFYNIYFEERKKKISTFFSRIMFALLLILY